ncbi:fumarate/nitrate reduction transcriptional regulator Fnr [Gilvimarinus agarilyticus]|uniref:fumarate/nitrate reduction transcriptional regulator Fnr n=1 Tax=unclassified Gilvimarinus TaxID=2642066 RepID=UPI001C097273|nr:MULTISPECIES: fumarate/nitrate reduction transcriptional regulator Fnr [unclassified Gilvimarinus]MBU2884703.1 fumarate/nitrate reduction transcriptional regulator Fnr [Gilvimarinus agarilyticus]MDO6569811.1 fumarate/nitrate reduction transcriptional regulator Fnr [Gilvimarinus sp. 2_MG-2023]MDO6747375.1 fumarate/nitrate reduction transcriptional regulator Fnr [Gilvimarinus sp. 1_MG-2023]
MNQHQHRICTSAHSAAYTHCSDCRLNSICLPLSLEFSDIDKLDSIVERGKPLQKGDAIYRQGDSFKALFAIRSGAIKTFSTNTDGEQHITGLYLPGEVVGLDGPADNQHVNSAIALQTTSVCAIPYQRLEALSRQVPGLQRNLLQLLSREINADQKQRNLLGRTSAEVRVASLLLSISARLARHNLSAVAFTLPMSRSDMANFLGLTLETVSRVFGRLQKLKILSTNRKDLVINDLEQLQALTHKSCKDNFDD